MKAVQGLVNPTPTPITGNPFFDAVVSQIPVVGAMMALTGFLQDLGVPSTPAPTGAGYQAGAARQQGGQGQGGQDAPRPNPILQGLVRTAGPAPIAPPPVVPQPIVTTTQGGVTPTVPTGPTVAPPPVPGLDIFRQGRLR